MYDILQLNGMKVAELREIAGSLEIAKSKSLNKQDLIYGILDAQALNPKVVKEATGAETQVSGPAKEHGGQKRGSP